MQIIDLTRNYTYEQTDINRSVQTHNSLSLSLSSYSCISPSLNTRLCVLMNNNLAWQTRQPSYGEGRRRRKKIRKGQASHQSEGSDLQFIILMSYLTFTFSFALPLVSYYAVSFVLRRRKVHQNLVFCLFVHTLSPRGVVRVASKARQQRAKSHKVLRTNSDVSFDSGVHDVPWNMQQNCMLEKEINWRNNLA